MHTTHQDLVNLSSVTFQLDVVNQHVYMEQAISISIAISIFISIFTSIYLHFHLQSQNVIYGTHTVAIYGAGMLIRRSLSYSLFIRQH